MDAYTSGILSFITTAIVFIAAFRQFYLGHRTVAVTLLVAGGLLLRLYCSADWFLHPWDERYHALVAKNLTLDFWRPVLYQHPVLRYDPADWTANHIWLHKQPVTLWLMAISIKLFGVNELSVRLPSMVASLVTIKLVHEIAAYLFDRQVAFIASFLASINGLILDLAAGRTATDHVDVIFLFFTLLTVYLIVRYVEREKTVYLIAGGLALGLAVLTKWLPALICLAIFFSMMSYKKGGTLTKHLTGGMLLVGVAAVLVLSWHVYINNAYPVEASIEYGLMNRHLYEPIEGHAHTVLYHFDVLRINYGELVYLPAVLFTMRIFQVSNRSSFVAVAIWFWLTYGFFSLAATKMQAYTLIAAPAVFIMTAYTFLSIFRYAKNRPYKWFYHTLAILLLALPVRHTIERSSFFAPRERTPTWSEEVKQLDYPAGTIIFNSSHPVETMFYHDYIVYRQVPDSIVLEGLREKGYNVVVLP